MSGAIDSVSKVVKKVVDPFNIIEDTTGVDIGDPMGMIFGQPIQQVGDEGMSASEQDQMDAKNAARESKKKKKSGTDTVLTSPLGATETAATAVTKLGGM